jgi:FHA domain-containing protein
MQISLINLLIIAGALGAALVLMLIVLRVARWRHELALRRHDAPVLVMPVRNSAFPVRPVASREMHPVRSSPPSVRTVPPEPAPATRDEEDVYVVSDDVAHRHTDPHHMATLSDVSALGAQESVTAVEASQVRFYRAEEGTLEFLPGRLEIVGGGDIGQEIHFIRPAGEENVVITFGRSEGPTLRHVQLLDPTVSRKHASLTFSSGRWELSNLSLTNPVILNGAAVPPSGRSVTLQDGDRIEMGAVTFLFRER